MGGLCVYMRFYASIGAFLARFWRIELNGKWLIFNELWSYTSKSMRQLAHLMAH